MKLTRRQTWMGAGLLGACGLLVADRLTGGANRPHLSLAASTATSGDRAIAGQLSGLTLLPAATPENECRAAVPDVFNASRIAIELAPPTDTAKPTAEALSSGEEFQKQFSLCAIVLGSRPSVLIGRQVLHIGDQLGEFKLRAIDAEGAEFVNDRGEQIKLPAPRRERRATGG